MDIFKCTTAENDSDLLSEGELQILEAHCNPRQVKVQSSWELDC